MPRPLPRPRSRRAEPDKQPTPFGAGAPRASRANSPGAGDGKEASARGCVQQRLAEGPPLAPPPALVSIDRSAVSKGQSENGHGLYLEGLSQSWWQLLS